MRLINGDGKQYEMGLPKIIIQDHINQGALDHILENTGLHFVPGDFGMLSAQPTDTEQIVALFMTYNFKTRHYDNADWANTLVLRLDHHVGFDVRSICKSCCDYNGIHSNGLGDDYRMAC